MEKVVIENSEVNIRSDKLKHKEPSSYQQELQALQSLSHKIFLALGTIVLICGMLIGFRDNLFINLIWTCIIAGMLGSTSSALISALQRKANGWETKDGSRFPSDGKNDMFSQRMATFFLYRPAFGIIGGLLVYYGMLSGYFGDGGIENESKVIFWALLAGLFVKTLIEKLKDLFDSLVGKK